MEGQQKILEFWLFCIDLVKKSQKNNKQTNKEQQQKQNKTKQKTKQKHKTKQKQILKQSCKDLFIYGTITSPIVFSAYTKSYTTR